MSLPKVILQDGFKYSLFTLPHLNAVTPPTPLILAADGYALSKELIISDPQLLRNSMGSWQYQNLINASRYLITYAKAKKPEMLDHENKVLHRRLHRFYLGILVSCPYLMHDHIVSASGAARNGKVDLREQTTYPALSGLPGYPLGHLTEDRLKHALRVGNRTKHIRNSRSKGRFGRVLRAYRAGVEARHFDERLHQFVRCAEAFLGSWNKREFSKRALEFTSNIRGDDLKQMFEIRSATAHLADWKNAIAIAGGDKARTKILTLRTLQAQYLAQQLIEQFVCTKALWPHYVDDQSVKNIWKMTQADRADLWQHTRIDFSFLDKVNLDEKLQYLIK